MQQPPNLELEQQWQQPQEPPKKSRTGYVLGVILAVTFVLCSGLAVLGEYASNAQRQAYENQKTKMIVAQNASEKAEQEAQQATTEAQAVPIPTNASLTLSGVGQQASHIIRFQQGLAIFTFMHDGTANFIVHLTYTKSNIAYYLANAIGSFEGSTAEGIYDAGAYVLDIQADGKWTVTIQEPGPTNASSTTSFHGKGQAATDLFRMKSGLKSIKLTHDGTSIFNVRLLDSNGNDLGYVVVHTGTFHGSKTKYIPTDGIYIFDIEADGNWIINIQ